MPYIENYDHCLRFQVLDKRISLIDSDAAEVVADNRGNICIHIEFDDQWDGCDKTVRFIYEGMWKDAVLNPENECICPAEVVKKGRFLLGVYGAELKTTTPIAISVAASILSESGEELPEDPTPGQYEQIMKLYAEATTAADEASKAAWDAVTVAGEAVRALNDAKEELEQGGFITGIKERNEGQVLSFWIGTRDEYNALPSPPKNCYVILTDEPPKLEPGKVLYDNVGGTEDDIPEGLILKDASRYKVLLVELDIFHTFYFGTARITLVRERSPQGNGCYQYDGECFSTLSVSENMEAPPFVQIMLALLIAGDVNENRDLDIDYVYEGICKWRKAPFTGEYNEWIYEGISISRIIGLA